MKGALAKVVLACVAVGLLLSVLGGLALPMILESEAVRLGLRAATQEMFGAPVEWERLEARLVPPTLTLHRPTFRTGQAPRDADSAMALRWSAESARVRFAFWPLFVRRIEIRAFASSGGEAELRDQWRSKAFALQLEDVDLDAARANPNEPLSIRLSARLDSGTAIEAEGTLEQEAIGALQLRLDEWRLRPAVSDLDDPVGLGGQGALVVRASEAEGIVLEASVDFASAGRLRIDASRRAADVFELRSRLTAFDLGVVDPALFGLGLEWAGRASGKLDLFGDTRSSDRVHADLVVESARLRTPEYVVEGRLPIVLEIEDPFADRPKGRFELELTEARLAYRDRFEKAPGTSAEMTTRFVRDASGEFVFESRVGLRDLDQLLLPGARTPSMR